MDKKAIEAVWEVVKFTISECPKILSNMHMDHIVICSIYSICRKFKIPISFSKIFQKYEKLNFIKTDINQKNIKNEGDLINLKEFYNKKFLNTATRRFIMTQSDKAIQLLPGTINVERVSQSSFRYTEGKYQNKIMLKRMNLDSPLHKTIPNLVPSSDCPVTQYLKLKIDKQSELEKNQPVSNEPKISRIICWRKPS